MRRHLASLALLLAAVLAPPAAAADCGSSVPCAVASGEYRIELPPDAPARGVLLFFHGYNSTAEDQMKARALIDAAHRHGLAFAAPNGLGRTWSHPGVPDHLRDERVFVSEVLDDLRTRFGFGPRDVIVGGFSQGASMAYYSVCADPERFAGAVMFAGVFWMPLPTAADCAGPPPPIVHFHGKADHTFPLEGRGFDNGRFRQGNTFESLAIVEAGGACTPADPVEIAGIGCTVERCDRGPIDLCLHPGGHEVRAEWLDAALTRLGR